MAGPASAQSGHILSNKVPLSADEPCEDWFKSTYLVAAFTQACFPLTLAFATEVNSAQRCFHAQIQLRSRHTQTAHTKCSLRTLPNYRRFPMSHAHGVLILSLLCWLALLVCCSFLWWIRVPAVALNP